MAIVKKGIIGGIRGSVAHIVGYKSNGKSIIRSKTKKVKKSRRSSLGLNGQKLLALTSIYGTILPNIERLLSLARPDLSMTWNNSVRSLLGQPCTNTPGLVTQISLGVNQFETKLNALCGFLVGNSEVDIIWSDVMQLPASYPDSRFHYMWYQSWNNQTFSNDLPPLSAQGGLGFSVSNANSGDSITILSWFESAVSGLKSQASITVFIKP